eukprot:TRINITY_DN36514_c0_g1_i1.p1 TRINITY_DN36514_c0_g1~~TRINITY_DN36514_c0_g1_i1.p1  ORF type:complete len:388 (+),score=78.64 TRINITY_DN36514_c0_g1_i1:78-1166(+)
MVFSTLEPICSSGEVVPMKMLSGEKQAAEAQRLASLQSKPLSNEEKESIKIRRAACGERRAALAKAEKMTGGSSLQAKIAQRRAALQQVDREMGSPGGYRCSPKASPASSPTGSERSKLSAMERAQDFLSQLVCQSSQPVPAPVTPNFGEEPAPVTPPNHNHDSMEEDPVLERRRKSRRITFSAMTGALDDICEDPCAASDIQKAQELAAAILQQTPPKKEKEFQLRMSPPRFGGKRSVDGKPRESAARRSSVSFEAMVEKAKVATASADDDNNSDEDLDCSFVSDSCVGESTAQSDMASLNEALPLLATPGRFRYRGDLPKDADSVPSSPMAVEATVGSAPLPPPPSRPVRAGKARARCKN